MRNNIDESELITLQFFFFFNLLSIVVNIWNRCIYYIENFHWIKYCSSRFSFTRNWNEFYPVGKKKKKKKTTRWIIHRLIVYKNQIFPFFDVLQRSTSIEYYVENIFIFLKFANTNFWFKKKKKERKNPFQIEFSRYWNNNSTPERRTTALKTVVTFTFTSK